MSTEDHWTSELGKCPCGAGTVSEDVVSPDNMYGKTTRKVAINCTKCSQEWELAGRTLTLKSSKENLNTLVKQLSAIEREIARIKDEVIAGYFTRNGIGTMKAEYEDMQRLGFFAGSLQTYRNRRGTVSSPPVYQFLSMDVDGDWLMNQASVTTAKTLLEGQHEKRAEIKKDIEKSKSNIVRKSLSDM